MFVHICDFVCYILNNILCLYAVLGQLMHLTYFATPLELRNENVSKMNENFDLHCKCLRIVNHIFNLIWKFEGEMLYSVGRFFTSPFGR